MKKERRYDIDWIRVLVFDILIFYHVGMFFVEWGWHIKNNEIVDWIEYPMKFTNQWRIPILFVISGMGTRFALSYKNNRQYIQERVSRLFIPLLFGMLVIVPPQVYLERLTQGNAYASFVHFYPDYFNGIYPQGNFSWHHLWFLPYLLLMSIAATPLFIYLRRENNVIVQKTKILLEKSPFLLYLGTIPLILIQLLLAHKFPITHAFIDDWYAIPFYFTLFILGYLLICSGTFFWKAVLKMRFWALGIGVLMYVFLQTTIPDYIYDVLKVINMWSWILTIFGFSARYLNKESELIKYRNKAVYPFYILHQTITIICGYYLMNLSMHYSIKMLIMVIVTFGGSWLIYEFVILKIKILQPLFGVKFKKH